MNHVQTHSDLSSFPGPRQLALKALNERLKRVEDQSVWPSMDDDEEEAVEDYAVADTVAYCE